MESGEIKSTGTGLKGIVSKFKKRSVIIGGIAFLLAVLVIGFILIIPSQNATRARLSAERDKKLEELTQLNIEKDTMQELSALVTSKEYLVRYLRRTHGYMFEGDIRLDLNDPNAEIPTPDPDVFPTADPTD